MATGIKIATAEQFIDAVVNKQSPPKDKNGTKLLIDDETWNKNNEKGRRALLETVVDDDEIADLLTVNGMSFDVAKGLEGQGADAKNNPPKDTTGLSRAEKAQAEYAAAQEAKGRMNAAAKGQLNATGTITTAEQFIDAVANNATAPKDQNGNPLMAQDLWDTANPAQRKRGLGNVVDVDQMEGYLRQNGMSGFGRRRRRRNG
uniref:Uncharacterized protein n=1 Tax=Aplanochytrium stocchinoi TaxID=215587 RepID=A0A6S8ARV4_9STRA|mmetsp:Transcript_15069/g.17066  ORF Transcript_15069/g.17066 Transcript_15069/m.17066 type:complete len:203 (+) Transcript_15069:168-776(+)|eukprot:CAMPEP_0204877058 /NCGR_PEP_ID=MMETSP1348-20121228/47980_1 /ASSEMBLY_ACC=CAM_ASM_000700 /TAXON_ID=215587 /ORGANISM="Aplanochytrium stocchinoi, Strain GSBS06" /LENGTH=202 /DNA_ID=CAMNT_0052033891 /DNA_START=1130 /DNA_END=1738 /DNA_ORIENTATION=+